MAVYLLFEKDEKNKVNNAYYNSDKTEIIVYEQGESYVYKRERKAGPQIPADATWQPSKDRNELYGGNLVDKSGRPYPKPYYYNRSGFETKHKVGNNTTTYSIKN